MGKEQRINKLTQDYELLQDFMDNIPDSIWFKDLDHKYLKVNKAKAEHLKSSPEDIIGKTDHNFFTQPQANKTFSEEEKIVKNGKPVDGKVEQLITLNGEKSWEYITRIPWFDKSGKIKGIIGISRDITDLKSVENFNLNNIIFQDIIYELLEINLNTGTFQDKLDHAMTKILSIPWLPESTMGGIFIIESKSNIMVLKSHKNLHPLLQLKLKEIKIDEYVFNNINDLGKDEFNEKMKDNFPHDINGINNYGHYCMPILSDSNILGMLVLFVKERKQTENENSHLKAIANTLSNIISRKIAEDEIKKSQQTQDLLNSILQISMSNIPLEKQLELILDLILSVSWLSLLSKGSIHVLNNQTKLLELKAHKNLPDDLLIKCGKLPFGKCLCGKAASTKRVIFKSSIDDDHHVLYDGIKPHGHYCLPLITEGNVLGVLNTYVDEGYRKD
ncbi:MAG: PAS domain-containing protein, partial [Gammaproteobacteria bacterium]|nr:PAS domain-containing protein [Gammaproteobacteria bacterium]